MNLPLFLQKPYRVVKAALLLKMDDGSEQSFDAYRVQYNNVLGPMKGGIRYHPGVNEAEVTELAFLMTLKCSLAGLPYGGAKGGIAVDPSRLSVAEKERLTRAYVRAFYDVLGSHKDIPAPDVNTNAETMLWFLDEWGVIAGEKEYAVVTGKPIEHGGSLGREEATGLGGAYVVEEIAREHFSGTHKRAIHIAVQGYGNVGRLVAKYLHEWGYTVVALSNTRGGIYNSTGIDVEAVAVEGGTLQVADSESISNEQLLTLDVDILIPAALGHVITEQNASAIRAQWVVEMANAPITEAGDAILAERGVRIVPDILANAGGVIVSYFEWLQNIQQETWAQTKVHTQLHEYMVSMWRTVSGHASASHKAYRSAAYDVAIERIERERK